MAILNGTQALISFEPWKERIKALEEFKDGTSLQDYVKIEDLPNEIKKYIPEKIKYTDIVNSEEDDYSIEFVKDGNIYIPVYKYDLNSSADHIVHSDPIALKSWVESYAVKIDDKKTLSTNDFTDGDKKKLDDLPFVVDLNYDLNEKVDKIQGWGLSEKSFTTNEKNKLATLHADAIKKEITNSGIPDYYSITFNDQGKPIYKADINSSAEQSEEEKILATENYVDDNYVKKDGTKGLSTNDFTTKEKEKLTDLPTNSQLETKLNAMYRFAGHTTTIPYDFEPGEVYNLTQSATTTADFVEGAGIVLPKGTNIVAIADPLASSEKWDIFSIPQNTSDPLKVYDISSLGSMDATPFTLYRLTTSRTFSNINSECINRSTTGTINLFANSILLSQGLNSSEKIKFIILDEGDKA